MLYDHHLAQEMDSFAQGQKDQVGYRHAFFI